MAGNMTKPVSTVDLVDNLKEAALTHTGSSVRVGSLASLGKRVHDFDDQYALSAIRAIAEKGDAQMKGLAKEFIRYMRK